MMDEGRRGLFILAGGALAGILLALLGMLPLDGGCGNSVLPDNAVARVGDVDISKEAYLLALRGTSVDKKALLSAEERRYILERLIEDELLVQRALELGLEKSNPLIRAHLGRAMVDSVVSEASTRPIDEDELKQYFAQNRGRFATPAALLVKQVYCRQRRGEKARPGEPSPALKRATQAYRALQAGEDFDTVQKKFGDSALLKIPGVLLPPAKLREYVGPGALQKLSLYPERGYGPPIQVGESYRIFLVLQKKPGQTPSFASIQARVREDFRKRRDALALREYLDDLKRWTSIVRVPPGELPAPGNAGGNSGAPEKRP